MSNSCAEPRKRPNQAAIVCIDVILHCCGAETFHYYVMLLCCEIIFADAAAQFQQGKSKLEYV